MVLQCGAGAWLMGLASGDWCRRTGSGSTLEVNALPLPVHSQTTSELN